MNRYVVSTIYSSDQKNQQKVLDLLNAEGIRKDINIDYTCGIFDEKYNLIATGSCFKNTIRCLAVDSNYQGFGLMNQIVTHLMEVQYARSHFDMYLYTKAESAKFFSDLGFYEVANIDNLVVFMENKKDGFEQYLRNLKQAEMHQGEMIAAIIMNANPFTLGHLHLVEKAARENDLIHLFIVSEDSSLVPFSVRKKLVVAGTAHLDNIVYHDTGPYIISNATFPTYFQKDEDDIIKSQTELDVNIFSRIANELGITRRYIGEEPTSLVTGIYNQIMQTELPKAGVEVIIIPRKEVNNTPISASTVRIAIQNNDIELLQALVPKSTFDYFNSEEAAIVIDIIRKEKDVVHY